MEIHDHTQTLTATNPWTYEENRDGALNSDWYNVEITNEAFFDSNCSQKI